MKIQNEEIKITEIQDSRIWIHSNTLGYGKWIYNSELIKMIEEKATKNQSCRNSEENKLNGTQS